MQKNNVVMVNNQRKKSFRIFLFTICFAIATVVIILTGIFPIDSKMILVLTVANIIGFGYSYIVRKMEKVEERW